MVYGELGKFPIEIDAKVRMLGFWHRICTDVTSDASKISSMMYKLCLSLYMSSECKLPWIEYVHSMLNELGLSYVWVNQSRHQLSLSNFKRLVKQRLQDQYLQTWHDEISQNNVCYNYRIFKKEFCFEQYLISLPSSLMHNLLKFRLSNHTLPVQYQRQFDVPREERVCHICNLGDIGDEFHYLFICDYPDIKVKRTQFLSKYYLHHVNTLKFYSLMNSRKKRVLVNLSKFVKYILSLMKQCR